MRENIYYRHGKKFRKIGRSETILEGAMHSWCGGELMPIIDPSTVGDKPENFSDEREFYNPILEA